MHSIQLEYKTNWDLVVLFCPNFRQRSCSLRTRWIWSTVKTFWASTDPEILGYVDLVKSLLYCFRNQIWFMISHVLFYVMYWTTVSYHCPNITYWAVNTGWYQSVSDRYQPCIITIAQKIRIGPYYQPKSASDWYGLKIIGRVYFQCSKLSKQRAGPHSMLL